jgi:AbrB family looped-hinge helix DNA binding protein
MTSKGQLTVPKGVREALGLKAGTKVVLILEQDEAVIRPKPKDALDGLRQLRKHIWFTEQELKGMIRESKRALGG